MRALRRSVSIENIVLRQISVQPDGLGRTVFLREVGRRL